MKKSLVLIPIIIGSALPYMSASQTKAPERQTRPNILFCIADDASFPYLSAYGCKWVKTPNFDRIAKGGIIFSNAYTCSAKSAPSRSSILTGRNTWTLKEAANHSPHFPAEFKSIVETLGENGYNVGYTGKGWAPGDPGKVNGVLRKLTGNNYSQLTLVPPTKDISNDDYAGNFNKFLTENKDKPWFFWYGGIEPHRNYEWGSGIKKGHKSLTDIDKVPPFWPDNDTIRTDMLDYAFEVEYFDNQLGKILDFLTKSGQLENTLIVVTSDNGMPFPRVKGNEYEMSNHLPLAMMWQKGIRKTGRVINDMVSFSDLAPTFAQVASIDWAKSGMKPATGKSLTDILYSDKDYLVTKSRDHVLIGRERNDVGRPNDEGYPIRGIVKDGFILLKNYEPQRWPACNPETGYLDCDGSPTKTYIINMRRQGKSDLFWKYSFDKRPLLELYNIRKDPQCLTNLIGDKSLFQFAKQLEKQMEDELKVQGDPRMFGNGAIFDHYPYSGAVKDFYNRFMKGEIEANWVEKTDFEPLKRK
jgi:N-sulfoglucosamine sulfohydrolase